MGQQLKRPASQSWPLRVLLLRNTVPQLCKPPHKIKGMHHRMPRVPLLWQRLEVPSCLKLLKSTHLLTQVLTMHRLLQRKPS